MRDLAGTEGSRAKDSPWEGGLCQPRDQARYTDRSIDDYGTIARTTFGGQRIGSLRVDPDNPRFVIVTEFGFPFLGTEEQSAISYQRSEVPAGIEIPSEHP